MEVVQNYFLVTLTVLPMILVQKILLKTFGKKNGSQPIRIYKISKTFWKSLEVKRTVNKLPNLLNLNLKEIVI